MPTVSKYPSLERSPGKADNWVEQTGGLPAYIDKIARSLHAERGYTIARAIATAVEACRKWAAGGGNVNPDTRAKAAAALAQWEAKKAQAKARRETNLAAGVHRSAADYVDVLDLSTEVLEAEPVLWIDMAELDADEWELVDLAPGDHRPPYHWKHGYIPITPAAALSQAKGNKVRAAKLLQKGAGVSPADAARKLKGIPTSKSRKKVAGERRRPAVTEPMRPAPSKADDDAARGRSTPAESSSGGPKALSDDQLFDELTKLSRMQSKDATRADRERFNELSNERHRRAETGQGRFGKLKGKTVPITTVPAVGSAEDQAVARAAARGIRVGAKVDTDQGPATVKAVTSRSITLEGDGGTFNVQQGTPGAGRIKATGPRNPANAGAPVKPGKALDNDRAMLERTAGADPWKSEGREEGGDPRGMSPSELATQRRRLEAYIAGRAGGTASDADVARWTKRRDAVAAEQARRIDKPAPTAGRTQGAQVPNAEPRRRQVGDMVTGEDLFPGDTFEKDGKQYRVGQAGTSSTLVGNKSGPNVTRLKSTVKLTGRSEAKAAGGELRRRGVSPATLREGAAEKKYGAMAGPALAAEVARRGIMSESRASGKSDAQLRTALREHDRNPSADREDNARARSTDAAKLDALPWSRSSARGGQPAVSYSPKHEQALTDLEARGLIRMDRRGTSMYADDQYVLTEKGKALVGAKDLDKQTQDRARAELARRGAGDSPKGGAGEQPAAVDNRKAAQPGSGASPKEIREKKAAQKASADEAGRRNAWASLDELEAENKRMVADGRAMPATRAELAEWQQELRKQYPKSDAPAGKAGPRVEHTPDGTLVHDTDRGDTEANAALKAAGFKWSRNLGAWYLPRTWGEATRNQRVKQLEAKLGDRLTVERQTGPRKSAAERDAETRERAAARAERMDSRAEKRSAEAERRLEASDLREEKSGIPFGQPILVGHHSERRHRRALEKAHANLGKGVEAQRDAERASEAAERARRTAAGNESKVTIGNRIERNEALLRKLEREKRNPDMQADLRDTIEFDKGKLKATGGDTGPSKETVQPGDFVKVRGQWYPVTRANTKTVGVPNAVVPSRNTTAPWREVQEHKTAAEVTREDVARMVQGNSKAFPELNRMLAERAPSKEESDARKAKAAGDGDRAAGRSAGGSDTGQSTTRDTGSGDGPRSAADIQRQVVADAEAKPSTITAGIAERMTDEQLERAMARLGEANAWDSPAMKALEKELDRRDAARARGENPGPKA